MDRLHIDADVAVCSSSGWAHGARGARRAIVYCHAPARWLYQTDQYTDGQPMARAAVRALGPALRRWDAAAAARAHRYLVNSTVVAADVRDRYGIDAEVLAPPVTIDALGAQDPIAGIEPGAFVCVSRLLRYKHVDAIVAAFMALPGARLVVVGDGPDAARVRSAAPGNVRILGAVSDAQLRWLYANARGLVAAAYEDFGLTPLEAAAFGRPSAVLAAGGYLDTVIDGHTGLYFAEPSPRAIAAAISKLDERDWDADELRAQADRFSEEQFTARLRAVVDEVRG
jgi:glycosyltransferase involved in cell wall biosynthesis